MTGGTALATSAAAVSALQAALRAEHAAVYGYGVVGAHLTGAARTAATSDWIAHQVARDSLEAMLRAAAGSPRRRRLPTASPIRCTTGPRRCRSRSSWRTGSPPRTSAW